MPSERPVLDLPVMNEGRDDAPTRIAGETALLVRNLGKKYRLYDRPIDRLKHFMPWGGEESGRDFWALKNVSFEVRRGETVGIVGLNGSGKSTLLQIIAGTLRPTAGEVELNGRVAALLELGSGFDPEFTGRENVYLNGAIWGFSRREIDELFDRIAAFADIGQFIDQAVKFYSSGMFVRLAFAVQVFAPREVFVVDEALSVGDEAFQRKCMAALEGFREKGGTVLIVSHDTQTIVRQSERCLLLSRGRLLADGRSKPVTDLYQRILYSDARAADEILKVLREQGLERALLHVHDGRGSNNNRVKTTQEVPTAKDGPLSAKDEPNEWFDPNLTLTNEVVYGNGDAEITDYGIYNEEGRTVNVLVMGQRYRLTYLVRFHRDAHDVQFGMMLKTVDGLDAAGVASRRERVYFDHIPALSVMEVSFQLTLNVLPGRYFLNAGVDARGPDGQHIYLHRRVDICMIQVLPCDSRESWGLAYLEPSFSYAFRSNTSEADKS